MEANAAFSPQQEEAGILCSGWYPGPQGALRVCRILLPRVFVINCHLLWSQHPNLFWRKDTALCIVRGPDN